MKKKGLAVTDRSLATLVQSRIYRFANRPALHYRKEGRWASLSWQGLGDQVKAMGRAMIRAGVEPGAPVVILSENRPEAVAAHLAAVSISALSAPLHPGLKAADLGSFAAELAPRIFFLSPRLYRADLAGALRGVPAVVLWEKSADAPTLDSSAEFLARGREVPAVRFFERLEETGGETEAAVFQGPGPSSFPLRVTHAQALEAAKRFAGLVAARPGGRWASVLPLAHPFEGIGSLFAALHGASELYLLDENPLELLPEARPELMVWSGAELGAFLESLGGAGSGRRKVARFLLEKAMRASGATGRGMMASIAAKEIRARLGGGLETLVVADGGAEQRAIDLLRRAGVTVKEVTDLFRFPPDVSRTGGGQNIQEARALPKASSLPER